MSESLADDFSQVDLRLHRLGGEEALFWPSAHCQGPEGILTVLKDRLCHFASFGGYSGIAIWRPRQEVSDPTLMIRSGTISPVGK